MNTFEAVKDFWETVPETTPDHYYGELEIREISKYLYNHASVLDVGCGDGGATVRFAEQFPYSTFIGMDYSRAMYEARKRPAKNATFYVGDVRATINEQYDIIISKRCLINLPTWDSQWRALINLKLALRPGGTLILVENTVDGLERLNELRNSFNLPEIKMRWHNQYFRLDDLLPFLHQEFDVIVQQNIGCQYYIISRVIHAYMEANQGIAPPRYDHLINDLASRLPIVDGPYSPNMLWVLRKQ